MLTQFLERRPSFGILASFSGFGASLVSFLHNASIVVGFAGAVFGLLAGIYTWRIKRREWQRLNDGK